MRTIIDLLHDYLHQATLTAFPQLGAVSEEWPNEVVQSTQDKFGDYQFNSAMKLSKLLKQNPRSIAEKIATEVETTYEEAIPFISKFEVAGPGFINMTIDPAFLDYGLNKMFYEPHFAIDLPHPPRRVIVEFSSPNTAKELHVGHLRSTIIGDSLARLFEFLGHDVLRLNHIGDWGTSFGMLIAYMKRQAPQVISGEEATDLTHLAAWYKAAKKHFDEDPEFKKASQMEVVALQGGNVEALNAWKLICEISRKSYQEIYDILDVKIQERGESYYNPQLPGLIADLESKGLITLSNGAKCVYLEGFVNREGDLFPLMVQKSDGGYNYDTTDMAAIRQRVAEEKADRIIYVTDAGQSLHFQMVFKAAEKAGYLDPKKVRVDHVPFGLVLGNDGKKFRTRSGETERLIDLLTAAVEHAKHILMERTPEMDQQETDHLAQALGIGAVKYADLSCHRTGDYTFSYDRMLKFEGNTAAFLMYAYVRVEGIKRKVKVDIESLKSERIHIEHPSEMALGMHLMQFAEALDQVAADLLPNRLTDYLYGLAEKFNAFFRDCRVEGSPQQSSRLLLCELTARVMKQGLHILGVHTVEKM